MHQYHVYILCSKKYGTLYIGVTNDIARRVYEHKHKLVPGFTSKYGIDKLVYAKEYRYISEALLHEKMLKRWKRAWKICLIEE
jgi:putative endonuclease